MDKQITQSKLAPAPGKKHWRRKWKRIGPERRGAAASALETIFAYRRGSRWLLPALLVVSLGLHATVILSVSGQPKEADETSLAASDDSYMKKVEQKAKAKTVSKGLAGKITMPPPPPDPEQVVSGTLTQELTGDIQKVIGFGNVLTVKETTKLKDQVMANLKDELAEASKKIAEGKESVQDIQKLQEEFKRKAHQETVKALSVHREETQVQNAQMSVNEWYENRVAAALSGRVQGELFKRSNLWGWIYGRGNEFYISNWAGELSGFSNRVHELGELANGKFVNRFQDRVKAKPIGNGWSQLADWPDPSAEQAKAMDAMIQWLYEGKNELVERKQRRQKPGTGSNPGAPGLEPVPPDWTRRFHHYLRILRADEYDQLTKTVGTTFDGLWAKLQSAVEQYQEKAEAGGTAAGLGPLQQACLDLIKQIHQAGDGVLMRETGGQHAVNRAAVSRVFRSPVRDKVYADFIDELVKAFTPVVQDMAETEFREGMVIRDKSAELATKDFVAQVPKLLKRDLEKAVPKPSFDDNVFINENSPYKSKVTNQTSAPTVEDIDADEKACEAAVAKNAKLAEYAKGRERFVAENMTAVMHRLAKGLLDNMTEDGRMRKDFYASVESVDYTDKVRQRLDARSRAMEGRGQDLARLTEDGVPDTSAPMVALLYGASKGHGASLEPVSAAMVPAHVNQSGKLRSALRVAGPRFPPPPASWKRVTQPDIAVDFQTPRAEGIPFLANFPKLDGDLRDWGKIRPLVLKAMLYQPKVTDPVLLYAAWNYQGFFFGYHVNQADEKFTYPNPDNPYKAQYGSFAYGWAYHGDYLRLLFDTLDGRNKFRGEPHTQEFVILPRGHETDPNCPGMERVFDSVRDAQTRLGDWHGVKASCKIFPSQPSIQEGPDGTGPFRATIAAKDGYSTEVFLPRSIFKVPVFAPGWFLGFEAIVGIGQQSNESVSAQVWANSSGGGWYGGGHGTEARDYPNLWGDLMLLGTDAQLSVQDTDEAGGLAQGVVSGHSYLVTVVDPDRNINLAAEDTVIVSVETTGTVTGVAVKGEPSPVLSDGDMEIFILKETAKNSSVFRGYVNTQPGRGRQVQGIVECMPGQEVRFGYVDISNAKGERNVVYQLKLPVLAGVTQTVQK